MQLTKTKKNTKANENEGVLHSEFQNLDIIDFTTKSITNEN